MTIRLLTLIVLALAPLQAQAQLRDPTEPPPAMRPRVDAASAAEPGAAPEVLSGPRLQSVLLSSKRQLAVIDGQTVRVGQKYRGAVVAAIKPTEVVLVRGTAREILKLYPAAQASAAQRQR